MPRVSQETMEKLNDFLNTLPAEARNKCALCNETLTHIVKSAEAQTGAPTATVTRELANRVNDGAHPGDVISGESLRQKVIGKTTDKNLSVRNEQIKKPEPEPKECPICGSVFPGDQKHCPNNCEKKNQSVATEAHQFCTIAISQLSRIRQDDMDKIPELMKVLDWIIEQISGDNNALVQCFNKFKSLIDYEKESATTKPRNHFIPVETENYEPPDCHGRALKVAEIDSILIQVMEKYPGRDNAQKRVKLLNDSGVPCSTGKRGKEPWTTKRVSDNYRHAKTRQAAKGSE